MIKYSPCVSIILWYICVSCLLVCRQDVVMLVNDYFCIHGN